MIGKLHFIFTVSLLFNAALYCQNSSITTSIALATELKAKYKDAEAVCLNSIRDLRFEYNNGKKDYCAILHCSEEYIFLRKDFKFMIPVFYDEFSSVEVAKSPPTCYVSDEFSHSKEVFHDDTRMKLFRMNYMSFGQKIKIEYEKIFYDLHYLTPLYLSGNKFPVIEQTLKVNVQNNAFIDLIEKNFKDFKIEKNISANPKKGIKTYTFSLKDAETYNKDKNNPGLSQIYPHILFQVRKMEFQKYKPVKYFENTNDLYQWYNTLVKQAYSAKDITVLTPVVNGITAGKQDIEKIKAIYYWVQDKIRYIAFENGISGFKPDSACLVFSKKYGDCKGMANLLVQMLKIAGFDAHHAWIGTKEIAYDYSTPTLQVNNHMICVVFFGDKEYYLDATEKCSAFGDVAERIQGRDILIEKGDEFLLKKTPVVNYEMNAITKKTNIGINLNDNKVEGSSALIFSGEAKADVLYVLNYTKQSDVKANIAYYLTRDNPNFKINDVKNTPLQNFEQNFELSFSFSVGNRVHNIENEYYVNFDFFEEFLGSSIDTARKFDYILPYKEKISHETEITIPDKFTVSYMPENLNIENEDFNININFKKTGNKVMYLKTISFPNARISTKNFGEWNKSMKLLRDLYNNQLVIKK